MIFIEKMQKKDSEDVFFLQKKCFSIPWSRTSLEEMFLVEGYHNFVARDQGILLGYIGMKAVCDEADITNVAVDPRARRRGIAAQLLQRLLAAAKEEGIRHIYLEVRETNHGAIRLYEQAGFRKIGRRKAYYDQPKEDALLMMWTYDQPSVDK